MIGLRITGGAFFLGADLGVLEIAGEDFDSVDFFTDAF